MWKPNNIEPVKLVFLDRLGWPVEMVKGRPVFNFLRLLIHTRSIITDTQWIKLKSILWPSGSVTGCDSMDYSPAAMFHEERGDV